MRVRVASVLMLALIGLGCSGDATGLGLGRRQELRRELARNQAKWDALALEDYRYEFRRVCECSEPATTPVAIEVRNASVYRVRILATGADLPPGSGYWPTIEELFGEIRLALDEGATDIEVRYDPVYGYPLEVNVDWGAESTEGIELFAAQLMPILQ